MPANERPLVEWATVQIDPSERIEAADFLTGMLVRTIKLNGPNMGAVAMTFVPGVSVEDLWDDR